MKATAFLVLLAATPGGVKAVEQNLFPIDLASSLVFGLRLGLLLGLGVLLLFLFFLRLDEVEERVVEKLLFEVLLQIQQRHIQEIHRLIKARIDLELLPELS